MSGKSPHSPPRPARHRTPHGQPNPVHSEHTGHGAAATETLAAEDAETPRRRQRTYRNGRRRRLFRQAALTSSGALACLGALLTVAMLGSHDHTPLAPLPENPPARGPAILDTTGPALPITTSKLPVPGTTGTPALATPVQPARTGR